MQPAGSRCTIHGAVTPTACMRPMLVHHADRVLGLTAVSCRVLQVTTDIPPHHFMRSRSNCEDVRDIDGTTRGLGATCTVPSSSCAEENILMVDDRSVKWHVLGAAKALHHKPARAP